MASFNKVILMGNLTRDPELRYTSTNRAVAKIGIACNHQFTTANGEKRKDTMFVDCEAWGRTAEAMNQYLSKGRPVFIEGRLKLDQWTDQSGQKRSKHIVVIENFQFVDPRGSSGDNYGNRGGGNENSSANSGDGKSTGGEQTQATSAPHQPIQEDDIPF